MHQYKIFKDIKTDKIKIVKLNNNNDKDILDYINIIESKGYAQYLFNNHHFVNILEHFILNSYTNINNISFLEENIFKIQFNDLFEKYNKNRAYWVVLKENLIKLNKNSITIKDVNLSINKIEVNFNLNGIINFNDDYNENILIRTGNLLS